MIELENISKSFGTVKAVNDLSLHVEQGELFSFLGPNGAGKTTTIKMIVGLLKPDSGIIRINGTNISDDPVTAKQNIGYVPDFPYLYEKLTGREFLDLIGNLYEIPSEKIEHEIEFYREQLGINDWLDDRIEGYSHGMKQRIVFTSAFLHAPKVLVIDEPMVGLDPKSARVIKQLLKDKTHEGITVFVSTHNLSVAEELSDRVAIIDKGNLLSVGPLESLRDTTGRDGNLEDLFLRIVEERTSPIQNSPPPKVISKTPNRK